MGRVIDISGLPLAGAEEEMIVPRVPNPHERNGGQKGLLTGYLEERKAYTIKDGVADFDHPPPWSWHCPCGAKPRVSRELMIDLVANSLKHGGRNVHHRHLVRARSAPAPSGSRVEHGPVMAPDLRV